MLLLTGPPGAGKGQRVLDQVRKALRRGADDFRLLVPTATMAEHLRNRLAREGFALRPGSIETLSKFTATWAPELAGISGAQLEVLIEELLDRVAPREFQKVAALPGFRAHLAGLIDEFATAGCEPHRLAVFLESNGSRLPFGAAFHDVYARAQEEMSRRKWALRAGRLKRAAENIRERGLGPVRRIFFDGFFLFTEPELALIDAVRRQADVTVTLPHWRGAAAARVALLAMGFTEKLLAEDRRTPPGKVLFTAPGLEQEVEEIARRILARVESGRAFRDIGIVVRSERPYVPALRAALERFGIPARFYFATPLHEHPAVRYLSAVIEAMLEGWEHEKTLAALRMAASGAGASAACDRFDFAVRERLPGRGLSDLKALAGSTPVRAALDRFSNIEAFRVGTAPPAEWAARARALRQLVRPPRITDRVDHDTAAVWRSQASALDAFEQALDETALALPGEAIGFPAFWRAAARVLQESPLRVRDHRRDVVHVMDVYEVRQWELPVLFLCGLLEKEFPLYYSEDPVFPDSARTLLQRLGVPLRTTADRSAEEEFLFQLAVTRAGSELVLSYPESNSKGDPNLPSFFLRRFALAPEKAAPIRPPLRAGAICPEPRAAAGIRSGDLLERLGSLHAAFRPTALEDFLQCPFQFFAKHTLCLEEPPVRPDRRLNPGVCGAIVHKVLAEWYRAHQPVEPLFERIFQDACRRERIPPGYAAELARISMLRDLKRFLNEPMLAPGWSVCTEKPVQFPAAGGVEILGRIDRFDLGPSNFAVVFDFKYSSAAGVRERIKGYEEGRFVQGGLYLLALEHMLGVRAAGMFYCGLRGEVSIDGWHAALPGFERTGTACARDEFRERLERTRAIAVEAAEGIRAGRIERRENDRCDHCAFRDVCRSLPAAATAAAGGGN